MINQLKRLLRLLQKHSTLIWWFVFVVLFLFFSFTGYFTGSRTFSFENILLNLFSTWGTILVGYFIVRLLAMPILMGKSYAKEEKTSLSKLRSFLFGFIATAFFLDLYLANGNFLMKPAVKFVSSALLRNK